LVNKQNPLFNLEPTIEEKLKDLLPDEKQPLPSPKENPRQRHLRGRSIMNTTYETIDGKKEQTSSY